jgi:Predicted pPIWI-associating nuclease
MSYRDLFGYNDPFSAIRDQMEQWDRITRGSVIDDALAASRTLAEDYERLTKPLIGPSVADEIADAATGALAAQDVLREEIARASALLPSREMIAPQDLGMLDLPELRTVADNLANHKAAYQEVLGRLEALRDPLGSELALASHAALESQGELRALLDQAPHIDRFIQDTLPGVEWKHLSETFGSITELESTTQTLIDAYHDLYSLQDRALSGLNSLVEGFPPVEVFNHTNLLWGLGRRAGAGPAQAPPKRQAPEPLREEVSEEARATLLSLIEARWPRLLPLWRGARQALDSKNPDRVRHYIVSYREVLTHVIHFLAPDEQVLDWVGGKPDYLHDGRPTRRARLLHISRNIERRNFGPFVVKDVDAAVAVFGLFNKGTHALEAGFSARDLVELQIRADNLLLFLLKVGEESDRSTN